MRKITLLITVLIITGIHSCKNEEWSFADFDYTTTYFPFQYPVRTLVLGDYFYDNENDNLHKFKISARVGGMYENHSNWNVQYQLDPSLVQNLITAANLFDGKSTASSDTLEILPAEYYTLTPTNQFTVPKGSFIGEIEVQLKEAFFNDPYAAKTRYVIPLRIISSTTDSILLGNTYLPDPDPRVTSDWITVPKNFTIFGIKYVNPYHGKYLHRGVSVITDTTTSTVLETIVYHQRYVENDEIWALQTISMNSVILSGTLRKSPSSPGKFKVTLTFDDNNNCVVNSTEDSPFLITGSGKYVKKGDMWGNEPQDAIHLKYFVTEGNNIHSITDTLVFRDKAVTFLEYRPVIIP